MATYVKCEYCGKQTRSKIRVCYKCAIVHGAKYKHKKRSEQQKTIELEQIIEKQSREIQRLKEKQRAP